MIETLNELNLKIEKNISLYSDSDLSAITSGVLEKHDQHPLGVCLCRKHHKLFHHRFGLYDNTPEQFDEFKNSFIKIEE